MEEMARELAEQTHRNGPVEVEWLKLSNDHQAAKMDDDLLAHLAAAAEQHAPGQWERMPSGAGHDAQVLAERMPAAMLFVPSIGGVSHSFEENTDEEDIVLGCQVLASASESILKARNR
jgi:N-carbamoyl-L-amino-acid hydrolase